jgi:hypothetical protein
MATFYCFIVLFVNSINVQFADEISDAVQYLKSNEKQYKQIYNHYKIDQRLAQAIVFPELIRYSLVSNLFETTALETVYVLHGKTAADFSIGHFQMKPSFVEMLETELQNDTLLAKKYKFIIEYKKNDEVYKRRHRVMRLQIERWQVCYLCCFIDLASKKFPEIKNLNSTETITFLATTYNHGFYGSFSNIKEWENKKTFPNGMRGTNDYSYSELSVYYSENLAK